MKEVDMFSDGEFSAVVAAAAYAVNKIDQKEPTQKRRKSVEFSETSLPKTKRKNRETRTIKLNSFKGSFNRLLPRNEIEEEKIPRANHETYMDTTPNENFLGRSEIEEQQNQEEPGVNSKFAEDATNITPNAKKKPSFTDDKFINDTSSDDNRTESEASTTTKFPTTSFDKLSPDIYKPSKADADADAWEKAQLIKIKNKYDKMISMINEWETEKKEKARKRLEKKQNEPESMRAKSIGKYGKKISSIEKVSGDAKALAEDKRRNGETKAYQNAAKIRSTGEFPRSRYCC